MRKGFTLIELLAVIVILAIIALIATPIVLNIIKSVKEESDKRSIDMYAKAIENSITLNQLTSNEVILGSFDYDNNESLLVQAGKTPVKIDYEGNVKCETIEIYKDGSIYLADCKVNNVEVDYTYGKDQSYDNGQIVYFDVSKGIGCTKNEYESSWYETTQDYLNSKTGYNGVNETGAQNSCLKFYAFLDDGSDKINLILDHNTTATTAWTNSNTNTNENGPIDIINQLKKDTSTWQGTIEPNNYEYKGSARPYIVDYSGYKARLITANEIAKITGASKEDALNWKEESSINESSSSSSQKEYYLDGAKGTDENWKTRVANSTNKSDYYWLYDRTKDCTTYGCKVSDTSNSGYWTSSATACCYYFAWHVGSGGHMVCNNYNVGISSDYGVRPVIEVLKSKLK